jgi:hypothetical protein
MAFSGENTADTEQVGSAMRAELEWQTRTSGYSVKQSISTLSASASPVFDELSAADQAQNPEYLVNGMITQEGEVSIVEVTLWNMEGPAEIYSNGFEYRQMDEALSSIPFFTWSMSALLPVLETSAEELKAVRAEAEAAKAETEAVRAEAEAAKAETEAARVEAEAAKAETEAARVEAEAAKAARENAGDMTSFDNAATRDWKSRWIYLGLRGGISPRLYVFEGDLLTEIGFTWETALQVEFQFLRFPWGQRNVFLALQGEGILTMDKFNIPDADGNISEKAFFSLMAPLLLKVNYKPGPFALSFYGGVYYIWYLPVNDSGEEAVQPALREGVNPGFPEFFDSLGILDALGYSAGFKFGVKVGKRGTIFLDLRYSSDIGITEIGGTSPPMSYRRHVPSLSLGFELGLFNRK